ncbi:LPXTG cell wall anchor domain-containing protein [Streptococcus suis]|uniref:LPXTG cell wall anchor domain-containing protein n=1 Tax=Streptococcus suis TaxID=1307 RepID=UPI0005CEE71C|nr:LPXTG cell wall anchor domain-containing protein [Streptococcus suis]ANC99229.1 methyl-accepting chemotaxis protein [Streptococcus suis]AOM73948.1 methyl-accepting chemotaxis protein [Streptococcus suis]MCH1643634.1 LPXTG cell wall anchor domain-containing protein [Streptococcus suis]MCL4907766.1 LPXTG cell wall anchor domain-containing protein [Streptococcus suis]MCL4928164.1 LPXTG cell wall anchor domain-containing protein [Streptococcus suis]
MSKQKVVTNLLLNTAVLGGFLICHVPSVSAETGNLQEIPTESATVSSENQTAIAVDGISPTDNQLPTSEEGDKQASEEKLVSSDSTREESATQVATDPDAPSQSLNVSEPEVSTADSNIQQAEEKLIQESNYHRFDTHQGEQIRNAVSIEKISADNDEIKWKVTFDRKNWTFSGEGSGYYFILPKGLQLTNIIDKQSEEDIFNKFPKDVNDEANSGGQPYRFFSREKNANNDERSFESQWGWSVGRVGGELEKWKEESSSIYFLQVQRDSVAKEKATYELTAQVTNQEMQTFPVLAVVKNFKERIFFSRDEITSAAGLRLKVSESAKSNNEGITIIGDSSPESDRTPEPRGDRTPDIDVPKADVPKVEQPKPKDPEIQLPTPKSPESVPPKVMPPTPKVPEVKTPKVEYPDTDAPKIESPKAPETERPEVLPPTPKVPEVEVPKVIPPTSKVPEAEPPKVEQPKPKVPEVHLPAPKSPETEPPKVMSPAPKVPDVKTPKEAPLPPKTPGVEVPKVMLPTPKAPEVEVPKVTPPTSKVPEAEPPKVEQPKPKVPEAHLPAPKSPEVEVPKVTPPTSKVPDIKTPKSPEVAHPEVEKPAGIQPEKGQPEVNKPNIIHPEVLQSEVKKTESGVSMAPKVGIQNETLPNTGETSNTLVWLGVALATLASSLYLFKQHRQREEE